MRPRTSEKEWLEDFKEFVETKGTPVPHEVSQNILQYVRSSLNPSSWLVFVKILSIHFIVGTLSLAICDQFGLNPFHTDFSLSQYFMKFGHSICMMICGFLFISLSVIFSRFILRQEEFVVLTTNVFMQTLSLSVFSLGVFMVLGAEMALSIALLWVFGAIMGGMITAHAALRLNFFTV
jgi:hypothetical protein